MIKILVDSASDYYMNEIAANRMISVPLVVNLCGTDYVEGINMERDNFYQMLENIHEFPKTSQPSPEAFLTHFRKAKEDGDTIICILLSSSLSGTCQSAHLAKNMLDYDNIYIIDTLAVSHMIRIMADYALKLIADGYTTFEIVEKLEALQPRVKVIAAVDTLDYLHMGGRLSKTAAAVGNLANLKPIITTNPLDGSIVIAGKALGKVKAVSTIMSLLEETPVDTDFPFYSLYTYGTENCIRLENKLEEKNYHIDKRVQVGSTIGAHVGPGAFGVIYVQK